MSKILAALIMSVIASTSNAQTNLEQYLHQQQIKAQTQSGGVAVQTALGDPEKQADAFSRIYATEFVILLHTQPTNGPESFIFTCGFSPLVTA